MYIFACEKIQVCRKRNLDWLIANRFKLTKLWCRDAFLVLAKVSHQLFLSPFQN